MTKDEIIKQLYPFYNPDIAQKDIEINTEAVKQLMEAYWIDQLKGLAEDLCQVHPEYIIVSRAGVTEKIELASFRAAKSTGANSANAANVASAGFRLNVVTSGNNAYSLSRQDLNNVLQDPRQLEFLGRINNAPTGGIKVEDAPTNSLSAKLGLRAGDIIVNVNGQPVMGTGDLARLYQQFATISEVRIEVKRAGIPMLLSYSVQN